MKKGLEGVIVDSTSISKVISEKSSLIYRGYPVSELVRKHTYESVVYLLWYGELPSEKELAEFKEKEKKYRSSKLVQKIIDILAKIPKAHPMDAVRTAVSLLGAFPENTWDKDSSDIREKGFRILSWVPLFIAAHHRFQKGQEFVAPSPDLSMAENFLYMCFGKKAEAVVSKGF